jgi:hypothetical protein
MSFVSNGGKFKLYTVLDGLIFPTPTQPRISFEHAIIVAYNYNKRNQKLFSKLTTEHRSRFFDISAKRIC